VRALLAEDPALINANAPWVETPIQAAAHVGHREIALYLLEAGAPLDICTAAMLGWADRVDQLLRDDPARAAATGAHGFPVLYYAVIAGDPALAQRLVDAGADINAGAGSGTPLHAAAMWDRPALARWLLERGADPTLLDYQDKTPLAVATERGRETVAALLRGDDG
jgi:ankyrin repeat protein